MIPAKIAWSEYIFYMGGPSYRLPDHTTTAFKAKDKVIEKVREYFPETWLWDIYEAE